MSGDHEDLDLGGPARLGGLAASDGNRPVSAAESVAALAATDAVEASGAAELAANLAIAEALAGGAIDGAAAQALLIEQVVAEQHGALSPAQRAELCEQLAAVLDGDPGLAALLR